MKHPITPGHSSTSASTRLRKVPSNQTVERSLNPIHYHRKRPKRPKSHQPDDHEARFTKRQWLEKPVAFRQTFYEGENEIVLKIENVRQSICRATLGIIDSLRWSSSDEQARPTAPKGAFSGLFQLQDLVNNSEIWGNIAAAYHQNQEKIKQFIPPKTSFRANIKGRAYQGNSWNNAKWTEFCATDGISSIVWWVVHYIFNEEDVVSNCKIWKKSCCPDSSKETGLIQSGAHREECKVKWKALKDHFLTELSPNDPVILLKTRKLT